MNGHRRLLTRTRMLPVVAVVLIFGHIILPYLLSHTALSAAVMSAVIVLIVVKHLGLLARLLGPLRARLRRR
ncbi:MAG TPA: hypothetical protein VK137_13040 [Planctomycetaceae bacterium]|nr:hypothetical protein [Planctomycetaceae bacterium]